MRLGALPALVWMLSAGVAHAEGPSLQPTPSAPRPKEPVLHFEVQHSFSRVTARNRVEQLLTYWRQRFGVQAQWAGDQAFVSGRVMGIDVRARIAVGEGAVDADANDPGALLRGPARDYIGRKLRKYLSPSYQES